MVTELIRAVIYFTGNFDHQIKLTLYLKETPFDSFANANRAVPDQAALVRAA